MAGLAAGCAAWSQNDVALETDHFRYTVSSAAVNLAFVDRSTGTDYLRPGGGTPCALARRDSKDYPATSAAMEGNRLVLGFRELGVEAVILVERQPAYLRFTVEGIRGGEIEALTFVNVPLRLQATPDEPFGACVFSLNLQTRVDALPALQSELRASCWRKFGIAGARVAMVGQPTPAMLPALKQVLADAKEMPLCRVAGPWAGEVPFNHGSYLFNFGSLTETNVQDWIGMAKSLGLDQIDNHGGGAFFRFGDFELDRTKWPDGWETFQRIVSRLHASGIQSIFHTYAFFIDKRSKYVAPIPDRRLDAFRTFTLAGPITADSTELTVNESTAGMSTVTGFFEHNSVLLHLGDELVTFGGVSQKEPWKFTGLKRGALGTQAASHTAGEPARHLKECFGLLVPDVGSSLFEEIAANHAEIVNRCGFDGLYLDAIDGSSILRGADECWYWADKFVFEIQKRLVRPVGMEMSAMWHHFWQYRTRWQAWDYPQRGHRRFIDLHASAIHGGLLLPLHLGWWNLQSFDPPQVEPTYPEVIEQLGARLIGWDAGISLTGAVDRNHLQQVPLFRRVVDILRTCEESRRSGAWTDAARAALREPGTEFRLVANDQGQPRFRRSRSFAQIASPAEPWSTTWQVTNAFAEQPLRFRVEALMSAASYEDPKGVSLADFAGPEASDWKSSAASGVLLAMSPSPAGDGSVTVTCTNRGAVARNGAWARLARQYRAPLNLRDHEALGLWVEGDGQGELLAVRLESPRHLAFGAIADRYVPIDFVGRRLLTLVETESTRWSDYVWNDGKHPYNVYRETIDFGAIESASVWWQNLPPGKQVKCRLGPIKAIPMLPGKVRNATLTLNRRDIALPVELTSGGWLECDGADVIVHYGSKGEELARWTYGPDRAVLRSAENQLRVVFPPAEGAAPRVRVTVFSLGPEV